MTLLSGWPLEISVDEILHGQGADPAIVRTAKPMLMVNAQRACTEGLDLIHPVALTREIGVRKIRQGQVDLEDDFSLTGTLVSHHLAGAQRIVAVVCTIGMELERTVSSLLENDPLYALALDGLGNAAVENLSQQICAYIGEQIGENNLNATTPLSPGNPGWPVDVGQPEIFSLLDASLAGISLTSGGMMVPKKSISFIVGIGPSMSTEAVCTLCSLEETCRYRHD